MILTNETNEIIGTGCKEFSDDITKASQSKEMGEGVTIIRLRHLLRTTQHLCWYYKMKQNNVCTSNVF